ncbi:MAG: hypothetical protein JXX29_18625 [Deltaproteobacteria bacterium]|nr:hypothetical protein [Deltaproteobacteria bacterium]MBN2673701.1 hypothetical protein [Deltaproteobacteria bacterium]
MKPTEPDSLKTRKSFGPAFWKSRTSGFFKGLADEEDGEHRLYAQCVIFQKRRVFIIGPAMLAIALGAFFSVQVWQTAFIVGVMAITNIAFFFGLQTARKQKVELSLWLAVIPTLATCLTVILLIQGFGAAMMLTAVSIVVQSSVFSKRISLAGAVGIFLLLVAEQALDNFHGYERYSVSPQLTFVASLMVGGIMVVQFWVYLRKHHDNSRASIAQHAAMAERQDEIIQVVKQIMPAIQDSVAKISAVSEEVAMRAQSQAEAMDGMVAVMQEMMESASGTSVNAKRSNHISTEMQSELQRNVQRLSEVSDAFRHVLETTENARQIMESLVSNTNNIESILSYNRDIGEHIKVLSVNASIEAAAAGRYGAGFAVVASELREMIDSTEKNLFRSASLLREIRNQTSSGMEAMDSTASMLTQFSQELRQTRETLIHSADNANAAARQVKQIAESTAQQQGELTGVSERVTMLLNSAFELAISSANLSDVVSEMDDLKRRLTKTIH